MNTNKIAAPAKRMPIRVVLRRATAIVPKHFVYVQRTSAYKNRSYNVAKAKHKIEDVLANHKAFVEAVDKLIHDIQWATPDSRGVSAESGVKEVTVSEQAVPGSSHSKITVTGWGWRLETDDEVKKRIERKAAQDRTEARQAQSNLERLKRVQAAYERNAANAAKAVKKAQDALNKKRG